MKELPRILKRKVAYRDDSTAYYEEPTVTEVVDCVNQILSYLESQKEGEDDCLCHLGEPPKKGCINYKEELKCSCAIDNVGGNCKWCREEPKECKHGKAYICAECNDKFSPVKEEPKQIDVEEVAREILELGSNWEPGNAFETERKLQGFIKTFKQALQQHENN